MFDHRKTLYFFFDFISHNAWLAWSKLPALAQKYDLVLEPVPVLFAALLKEYGQVGPAEVPAKARWMIWNVLRKARLHGIEITPPASHPFNPLGALRLACCDLPAANRMDLIDRLFRAAWVQGRAVNQPEVLQQIVSVSGMDANVLMAESQADAAKRALRDNTEAAIKAGVFGVPSMLAHGELFWGFDDIEHLETFLQGADPLGSDRKVYDAWFAVTPSAQRRR